jgi:hypothetical protein
MTEFCSTLRYVKYLITSVSVNTTINKQQLGLQFYSDMFRLTRIIFRLELYYFTKLLCSFWDLRRFLFFYIDVIYRIIIGGCNKLHCYSIILITVDLLSVCMDRGFGLVCYERRLDYYVLGRCTLFFSVRVKYSARIYGLVPVFGNIIGPANGQVPKLLMCSWSVPFPFPWFSGWCVFSSCWLRFEVALCYRGLSPCVLICNLRA